MDELDLQSMIFELMSYPNVMYAMQTNNKDEVIEMAFRMFGEEGAALISQKLFGEE